jgi:hypothetical protein
MRKVLAITVALMIAAIVSMPALGFTNQAAGNQSYTAKSGEKVDYSFTTEVPAHNLTPDMLAYKYSFTASAVKSSRMPYSFQQGTATPYSVQLAGVENAAPLGMKTKKEAAKLGSMNKQLEEQPTAPAEPVAAPVETVAPVESVAPAEPKFNIEGMVVDDNQTGLAGWTMNLTQAGAVVNSAITAADGKFAFTDLAAGEYTVTEVLMDGWQFVNPADGMNTLIITNESVTNLVFVNQPMSIDTMPSAENMTAPIDVTAPVSPAAPLDAIE